MPTQTTQTVYYDAQGNAFVPTGERRAPAAGEWYASIVRASSALQCTDGDDDEFNDWRIILRPALPHEDPRQVPACMTREGQKSDRFPHMPRAAEQSPNEAFFATLREYVQMEIAAREGRADMRSAVALLDALAERFDAAVDARVERALAHLEAQRQADTVSEGR